MNIWFETLHEEYAKDVAKAIWDAAEADPEFRAALALGRADLVAGRVVKWKAPECTCGGLRYLFHGHMNNCPKLEVGA